jgi:hypothetical protein
VHGRARAGALAAADEVGAAEPVDAQDLRVVQQLDSRIGVLKGLQLHAALLAGVLASGDPDDVGGVAADHADGVLAAGEHQRLDLTRVGSARDAAAERAAARGDDEVVRDARRTFEEDGIRVGGGRDLAARADAAPREPERVEPLERLAVELELGHAAADDLHGRDAVARGEGAARRGGARIGSAQRAAGQGRAE